MLTLGDQVASASILTMNTNQTDHKSAQSVDVFALKVTSAAWVAIESMKNMKLFLRQKKIDRW